MALNNVSPSRIIKLLNENIKSCSRMIVERDELTKDIDKLRKKM